MAERPELQVKCPRCGAAITNKRIAESLGDYVRIEYGIRCTECPWTLKQQEQKDA